jgi:hypothetical protein
VDAIQEFTVQTRGGVAEQGRSMGSDIVVVTRSRGHHHPGQCGVEHHRQRHTHHQAEPDRALPVWIEPLHIEPMQQRLARQPSAGHGLE